MLEGILNIVGNDLWNKDAIKFWKQYCHVDTSNLMNYKTKDINLCYAKIPIESCYKELYKFSFSKMNKIYKELQSGNMDAYKVSQDLTDSFLIKQLNLEELYGKFREMTKELEEKTKGEIRKEKYERRNTKGEIRNEK